MSLKVLSVFGTRPEAIKFAPVVHALASDDYFDSRVCLTGQHREMLDQVMAAFDLRADFDLELMRPGQTLADITARILSGVTTVIRDVKPELILVHGDTTTSMAAALAAYYEGVPIGHIEAGLRTHNLRAPFPEEANRSIIGRLADLHFAPTRLAKQNLLHEAVAETSITVTGNSVIDALFWMSEKVAAIADAEWMPWLGQKLFNQIRTKSGPVILITGHRRENFGKGFEEICAAIAHLASNNPHWCVIYPVHLNPSVQKPVYARLAGLDNVHLIAPLPYMPFVWLMNRSDLILTDSGGIQEEGPSLGKPVLVMREVTERPEAVAAGTVKLVGTDKQKIVSEVENLLNNPDAYHRMSQAINPYGDGNATKRIINAIKDHFGVTTQWPSNIEEFA